MILLIVSVTDAWDVFAGQKSLDHRLVGAKVVSDGAECTAYDNAPKCIPISHVKFENVKLKPIRCLIGREHILKAAFFDTSLPNQRKESGEQDRNLK